MHIEDVLVTGASGFIGRHLCPFLRSAGFRVREFEGRLENGEAVQAAAAGSDAIVHLAAFSDDGDFVSELLGPNATGVYHVLEAARREKVRRVVLASSTQAVEGLFGRGGIGVEERCPENHYGLLKLWAEDAGAMYSRLYSLSVIAVRLGWVARDPEELERMREMPGGTRLFLGLNDGKDFLLRCLRAPEDVRYGVFYAVSSPAGDEWFDMEPARRVLGFEARERFPEGVAACR